MPSVNRVILVGHLGRDPESRFLPSGTAVVNFSVATTETWKDDAGEKKERTEWSRCSAFGKTAEVITQYCKKGSLLYVEGKLNTRKYEKDGQDHYATEIRVDRVQFLSPRGDGKSAGDSADYAAASGRSSAAKAGAGKKGGGAFDQMDDEVPF